MSQAEISPAVAVPTGVRPRTVSPPVIVVLRTDGPGAGDGRKPRRPWARVGAWLASRQPNTFVALLAIGTMGPLVLLSTLSVNSIYSTLTAASTQKLADSSTLAAANVATELKALTNLEDSYAHRLALVTALRDGNHLNYDAAAILTAVKDLRAVQSGTRFAGIIDSHGFSWLNMDPPLAQATYGGEFTGRDWYVGVTRTGKAYVSSAYESVAPGTPLVIAIADPVRADGRYAPAGTVVGILLVGYDLSATQSLFSDFARHQAVQIEVTDQRGIILAQSGLLPTKLVKDTSAGVAAALAGQKTATQIGRAHV